MKKTKSTLSVILLFFVFLALMQSVAAEGLVVVNFYYSESCHSCDAYKPIIEQVETEVNYTGKVEVNWREVGSNSTNRKEWQDIGIYGYTSVVVNIKSENITNPTKITNNVLNYEKV